MTTRRIQISKLVLVLLAISMIVGCAAKSAVNAPLPTNAKDTADANAFRVIADAYAFISSVRSSVSSGALTLSPSQKTAFNDAVKSYNTAYAVGMAYHNGTSTNQATLTAATTDLSNKLQTATTQIPTAAATH